MLKSKKIKMWALLLFTVSVFISLLYVFNVFSNKKIQQVNSLESLLQILPYHIEKFDEKIVYYVSGKVDKNDFKKIKSAIIIDYQHIPSNVPTDLLYFLNLETYELNLKYDLFRNRTLLTFDIEYRDNRIDYTVIHNKLDEITKIILQNYMLYTEEDVVYAINDYIVKNYKYVENPKNSNPYSLLDFLLTKEGVCQPYALLAHLLFKKFGIESNLIYGEVYNTTLHLWTEVKINGQWNIIDTTWNDNSELDTITEQNSYKYQELATKYYLKTRNYMEKTHVPFSPMNSTNTEYKPKRDNDYKYDSSKLIKQPNVIYLTITDMHEIQNPTNFKLITKNNGLYLDFYIK